MVPRAQPLSERDWEDDDQVPMADLPDISEEQWKQMTAQQIEQLFERPPLKFIDLDTPEIVLNRKEKSRFKTILAKNLKMFAMNDKDPGTANHEGQN